MFRIILVVMKMEQRIEDLILDFIIHLKDEYRDRLGMNNDDCITLLVMNDLSFDILDVITTVNIILLLEYHH